MKKEFLNGACSCNHMLVTHIEPSLHFSRLDHALHILTIIFYPVRSMPPRGFTNPAPKTESARSALKSFFCDLCGKGYSRQNEFQAHESSYDHQHKQRLKDLKAMNKSMETSTNKSRKDDKSGVSVIKVAPIGLKNAGGGGFKKGGFKNAFGKNDDEERRMNKIDEGGDVAAGLNKAVSGSAEAESESDDEYELYSPRNPTGCLPHCKGRGSEG